MSAVDSPLATLACVLIAVLAVYAAGLYLASLVFLADRAEVGLGAWLRGRAARRRGAVGPAVQSGLASGAASGAAGGAAAAEVGAEVPAPAAVLAARAVTVLVPARNEGAMALRALQSVIDQDTPAAVAVVLVVKDAADTSVPSLQAAFPAARFEPGASSVDLYTWTPAVGDGRHAGPRRVSVAFAGIDGKAEKLNVCIAGLSTPYVAVLDADHQAHPGWLRSAVSRLWSTEDTTKPSESTSVATPTGARRVRMVQGRRYPLVANGLFALWDSLHQHVGCELFNVAFERMGLTVFFTGTTVLAETALLQTHPLRACITEDIDLSYTLVMEGERLTADLAGGSDEEVSPDLYSFLARRRRWANGHTDAFLRHLRRLGGAPLGWRARLQYVFHGAHYLVAAVVFALHLVIGLLFSQRLSEGAGHLGLGWLALGVSFAVAVAVARTQRTRGWRTRASEVAVLTAWFYPAAVMLANLALAGLLDDWGRLSLPLPEWALTVGVFGLLAPLTVLFAGLWGLGQLSLANAAVVALSYPLAFYLDLAGVLIGLVDFLAGRSVWQAVARAPAGAGARVANLSLRPAALPPAISAAPPGLPPEPPPSGERPLAVPAAPAPADPAPLGSITGVPLTPPVSLVDSWRWSTFVPRTVRAIVMAMPRRHTPVRRIFWLTVLGVFAAGYWYSRTTRVPLVSAPCKALPHDGDPWVVGPEHIPGYCEPSGSTVTAEGVPWTRRRGRFALAREDALSPPDAAFWERLDSTFFCNLAHFEPANVVPAPGGGVTLEVRAAAPGAERADRRFTAGSIATRDATEAKHLYGRFEAEIKPARASGVISAFFLYRADPWQEIDVEFLGQDTTKILLNVYYNPGEAGAKYNHGYAGTPVLVDLGFDAAEDFHRYAVEWDVDEIRWFVDDRLIHRRRAGRPTPIPHLPMRLHLNVWPTCAEPLAGPFTGPVAPDGGPVAAHFRAVKISGRAPDPLYKVGRWYDGVFGGLDPEPERWQDRAEWLQRHRAPR